MQAIARGLLVLADIVEAGLERALERARRSDPWEDRRLVGALEQLAEDAPDVRVGSARLLGPHCRRLPGDGVACAAPLFR